MEFSPFIDIFGWADNDYGSGISTETGGFTETVVSAFGVPVRVDRLIDDINADEYAGLAIPGGFEEYGYYEQAYDERLSALIRKFNGNGAFIASVCVGALALGKSGILRDKKAATYCFDNGKRRGQLADFGAKISEERLVRDGNIITCCCPETAPYAAFELLGGLWGEENMLRVKSAMGFGAGVPGRSILKK